MAPPARSPKIERSLAASDCDDLTKNLVPLKQAVERLQFGVCLDRQVVALMPVNEIPEPFAQMPRLIRHLVEFAGEGTVPHVPQHVLRHQPGLFKPAQ